MAKVTIYDIAMEAEISPSTVSRILRGGNGHIYPEATQQRVCKIAKRLGYRANTAARLLSQSTSTMIGMAVHFTEHPYLNRFLVAVHQELLKHEYDPVFLDSQHLSSESTLAPFPPPHMLAGFISPGLDLQNGWPQYYAEIRSHVPIVALQPVSAAAAKWVDVVQVDFKDAYLQAGKYLLQLGHRHIAYLGGLQKLNPSEAHKHKGWITAAKQLGLSAKYRIPWTAQKPHLAPTSNGSSNGDYLYQPESREALKDVVAQLSAFPEHITALVCSSDEVAIGFQSYLQSQGWKLPHDLSIIGYDGINIGEYVYPPLTTIAPDYNRMAEAAVDRLLVLIAESKENASSQAQTQSVVPHLIVRGSTTLAQ
jgi:DNA-binding LacI/PurR family transcriptional regulator